MFMRNGIVAVIDWADVSHGRVGWVLKGVKQVLSSSMQVNCPSYKLTLLGSRSICSLIRQSLSY